MDYRDMLIGNIYMLGEQDEDEENKYKLLSEDDEYYTFKNIENGKIERFPSYILNETNIYDITKNYRGIKLTKQRFGKDVASNVSEFLGINPKQMYKRGGTKRKRKRKRNNNKKSRRRYKKY